MENACSWKSPRYLVLRAAAVLGVLALMGCGTHREHPATVIPPPHWRTVPLAESRAVAQEPRRVPDLDAMVQAATLEAVAELGDGIVTPETIWATAIDCRDPRDPRIGSFRGTLPVYPASVIKLCYMVAAYDQNRTRGLPLDEATRGDLDRMIRVSSNAATARMVDRLSNTGFGPSLDETAMASFEHKRLTTYRLMQALGLDGLFAINKTYGTGVPLYGREVDTLGARAGGNFERSNKMTTDDTARLLYLIWRHALVDHAACEEMLDLMKRGEEYKTFFSAVVPEGVTLYSKGGSTDVQRHDAGIFAYPDGTAIIVVVFSNHQSRDGKYPRVIQRTAELLLERIASTPAERDNATADPDPTIGLD
ncbi:MAG: hypothetical protein PWP23_3084 [Candidatus Sumerlaeota bacterium]|nr:hypothetical protein [Candidatus Sumerlaeota bacterium]